MCFSLAVTGMRTKLPSRKVPTTLVLLLISRLMRSIPLFVLIRRRCSGGNSVQAVVSANPSRTVLAAAPSRIGSNSSAASPAFPPHTLRDYCAWIAFDARAAAFRLVTGTLPSTLR